MKRLLALAVIVSTLAPLRASANPCEGPYDILGHRAQRVADWSGIFAAVRPGEPVPVGDQAICEDLLLWEKDCTSPAGVVEHNYPPHSHLVAPAPGGGLWLSGELGLVGFRECGMETSYAVRVLSERYLLVTNQVRFHSLDYSDDDYGDCNYMEGLDAYENWLFDRITGVVLANIGREVTDARISTVGDVLAVDVDGKRMEIPLAEIAACAASKEREGGALARARVSDGRRQTRQKDYVAAIASFNRAIGHAPYMATAWSGRGYAEVLAGEHDNASSILFEALALDQDARFQAAVWFNIGLVAEERGSATWALKAFTRANTLKPSRAAARKVAEYRKKTAPNAP